VHAEFLSAESIGAYFGKHTKTLPFRTLAHAKAN